MRFLSAGVDFFDDEPDWIVLVDSVSFNKESIHLPLAGVGHGPLSIYLTKLSSLLFGETSLGYRFIIVLLNTSIIWLIFILTKLGLGEKEGLFAAFLTCVNSFLIYFSREIGCDGYFLFFSMLTIYFFFKATESKRYCYMLFFGITMGLALLDKLAALFLVPGFIIYLLISAERRKWFARPSLYLSVLISLLFLSPYLYWLYSHQWIHFRDSSHYFKLFSFPVSFLLFLGSVLRVGIYPTINSFGREYMSLGMGLLFIVGIIATIKRIKDNNLIQLMQLIFWSIVAFSVVSYQGCPEHFSECIIPAIILTAFFLNSVWHRYRLVRVLILIFFTIHLLYIPKRLIKINNVYHHHSLLPLSSWQMPDEKVNQNEIAMSLIPLVKKYNPTLVVTPNLGWDTIACYLNAQVKVKTLAPVPLIYESIKYNLCDWEKILIIDTDKNVLSPYINWARKNKTYDLMVEQEYLRLDIDNRQISLPISVAILSVKRAESFSKKTLKETKVDDFIINSLRKKYPWATYFKTSSLEEKP